MENIDIITKELFQRQKNNLYIKLNSNLSLNYAGYSRIQQDLKFVRESALYLKELQEHAEKFREMFRVLVASNDVNSFHRLQMQSFYFSSIIIYGKCFSSAEGRRVSLNSDFIKCAPLKLKTVHDKVIDTRNKYVAHGGYYVNDIIIPVLMFEIDGIKRSPPLVSHIGTLEVSMGNDVILFIQLIDHIGEEIDKKLKVIADKILNEENLEVLHSQALEELKKRKISTP